MGKFVRLAMLLLAAGCKQMPDVPTVISPYRIDIQQGNLVTQEMIAKLKPGMTRSQVRFALGSPLIVDPFRTDRWDYVYVYQKQGKETERRTIAVIFEGDKLVRIEGDVTAAPSVVKPAEPAVVKPPATAKPAPKPAEPKAETANTSAASDVDRDKPREERGFFGRVLEKFGF